MLNTFNQWGGGTDCTLPFQYALERKMKVDMFILLTDSQTWWGGHPAEFAEQYRRKMGINSRVVVAQMDSTGHTVNKPDDPLSLDVVGFDTATPDLISGFGRGEF